MLFFAHHLHDNATCATSRARVCPFPRLEQLDFVVAPNDPKGAGADIAAWGTPTTFGRNT